MSALVIVSSQNTALKWLSKSSAVKMSDCFDFFYVYVLWPSKIFWVAFLPYCICFVLL